MKYLDYKKEKEKCAIKGHNALECFTCFDFLITLYCFLKVILHQEFERTLQYTPTAQRERERKENHFKICPGRGNRQFEEMKTHPQFLNLPGSK